MRSWGPELRRRLEALHVPPGRVESVLDELSQHLDDRVAELMRGGQTEEQACRAALAELSDEELRDGGWADFLHRHRRNRRLACPRLAWWTACAATSVTPCVRSPTGHSSP